MSSKPTDLNSDYQVWTVEIMVSNTWIADGFDLTKDRMVEMLQNDLRSATSDEVGARIIKAPTKKTIDWIQSEWEPE